VASMLQNLKEPLTVGADYLLILFLAVYIGVHST